MTHLKVLGGRLQRPSPFLIRWGPRRERGWMLSETREKLQKILYFEKVILRLRLYLNVCSVWTISKMASWSNIFVRAPSSGGGSNAPRPAVSVPHLAGIGYVGRARQARCFLYFGRYTPELFLDLGICRAFNWTKKTYGKHLFQVGIISKSASDFVPTTRFSWSHLEAFGLLLSYDCCVVAFRHRISRLNTFVRAFVVFEGGRSLPNDIITPSVRADSSS